MADKPDLSVDYEIIVDLSDGLRMIVDKRDVVLQSTHTDERISLTHAEFDNIIRRYEAINGIRAMLDPAAGQLDAAWESAS